MNKFVIVSFAFLAWVFYEQSGGADFVPRKAELIAAAEAARDAENRAHLVAARSAPAPEPTAEPAPLPDTPIVTEVSLRTVTAAPTPVAPPEPVTASDPADSAPTTTLISLEQSGALFARPLGQLLAQPAGDAPNVTYETLEADIREVAGTRVNMRNGPGTDFGVLTSLPQGTEVEVIASDGTGWVKLRTVDDEIVGWMAEYLLTEG